MISEHLNIFSFLSIFTALSSCIIFIQATIQRPFKQATYTFSIFSAVGFFISLSSSVVLITSNYQVASAWVHLMIAGILFFPVSLLHFIIEISDFKISAMRKTYKFLFYTIPAVIFVYLVLDSQINVVQTALGFQLGDGGTIVYVSVVYLAGTSVLTLVLLALELYKRQRSNRSIQIISLIFSGLILYLLGYIIYNSFYMVGIAPRIPTTSVFLFTLFLFIAISTLFSRYGISNMSIKQIFEKSDDFIVAVDTTCKSLEVNTQLYNVLSKTFNKKTNKQMNAIDFKNLENMLLRIFLEHDIVKEFISSLLDSSKIIIRKEVKGIIDGAVRTYDAVIFPVLDNRQKLLGKVAIFRDVSDYKKLQETLREESIKDFLTGVYNRKYFYESLIEQINRFERYDEQFTLVMVDIDKFKRLNDRYGHLKGDWVLQEAAKILMENTRNHLDIVSRFGGDEFLIILASTTCTEAEIITQRMKLQYSRIDDSGTSLSIGICQFAEGMSSDEIIKLADSAMYKSKASGGNFVTML